MKVVTAVSIVFALALFSITPLAYADDEDDVMAVIQKWADLEGDLEAQAELIHDERVTVTPGGRQQSQADNLRFQHEVAMARAKVAGGPPKILVSIREPHVRVNGDTAVASFLRQMRVIPHNAEPMPTTLAWFTLVLTKERGDWLISYMSVAPVPPN